jgi:hypothetical protein
MKSTELKYPHIEGKTYSLFGDASSARGYFQTIKSLADKILVGNDIHIILDSLRNNSSKKRTLRRLGSGKKGKSLICFCLSSIHEPLKPYTRNVEDHLKNLPFRKYWDRRLATTEEQYHLYMLEIELTNRLSLSQFLQAEHKISLQPYCLQDFSANCKASSTGFDYQCKFCSKDCYQNFTSKILMDNHIEPYIWMGASIGEAVREAKRKNQTIGILGIACIPELLMGMRKCRKYGIPVIGLPLNANRCVRWFGEFRPNSVDLEELEGLVKANFV